MAQLCRWFQQPCRTAYYKPVKFPPKVRSELADPIKAMIEAEPSFGYRTVASLLGMNKNTVQRVFQKMGWQVRKCAVGHRPRVQTSPSEAGQANERWATDLCKVWVGRDGWLSLALVIDCPYPRVAGLAVVAQRQGDHGGISIGAGVDYPVRNLTPAPKPFLLRLNNGLVFTSRAYKLLAQLKPAPKVHHVALSAAVRDGRMGDPDAQGAVHRPTSPREPTE